MIKTITLREHFCKRPGMYISPVCMSSFQNWMSGVRIAEANNKVKEDDCIFPHLHEFEQYLRKRYKRYSGSRGTYGWALRRSKEDDVAAFHLWIKWYDEFLASRG